MEGALTNTICRNWAEKNEKIVKKVIDIRVKFQASADAIGEKSNLGQEAIPFGACCENGEGDQGHHEKWYYYLTCTEVYP